MSRRFTMRGAAATPSRPLISQLIPADDFARQVTSDELATLTSTAGAGRGVLCSVAAAVIGGVDVASDRAHVHHRELALFVRRNLRGTDAIAMVGDELLVLLDAGAAPAVAVAERLLAAVRTHTFSAASDAGHRLDLAIGMAAAPERGASFDSLLAAARAARTRAGSDGVAVADSVDEGALDLVRFVGRVEPLAQLSHCLDDTVRGVGRVIAVVGARGVGASTLLRTLTPEIRLRGGSLVVGTCREHQLASPYSLWSEVLCAVRRLPVKSSRQWRELLSLDPSLDQATEDALRGGSKTRLLEELADFLRLAAQQRPLVLLLEDMQWVDAASWDALEYLVTQLKSERILIGLTFQEEVAGDVLERWRKISSRPRHHEISLTHLTRDDVKRWLEGAMRTDELSRDLLAYVYRNSEGNPLAVTHLLRDLKESGHILRTPSGWQWNPPPLPAPSSLDALVARRVDRLPERARLILARAAVLARECDESLLLAGMSESQDARADLMLLLETSLLVPTYARGSARYMVAHREVARIVRERLPERERATLHAYIANALVEQGYQSSSEIAEHYELAGDRVAAHRFALRAADQAIGVHENLAAAEILAAAQRTAPSDEALAEVRVRMSSLAEVAGRYEAAESLCDEALTWYEAQGNSVQTIRLKRTRAQVRMKRGQGASETLTDLLALNQEAEAAGAEAERGAVLLMIAQMHWRLGDVREAQRVAEDAVKIAERGDDLVLISDTCNRLANTLQFADHTRSKELYLKSLNIAQTLGDAWRTARGLNNLGVLELISNNWNEARRVLTTAVEQARTAGLLDSWGRSELNLGVLFGRLGDYEASRRSLSEALRLTAIVQNSEEQLYATYNMAHLERESGNLEQAIDTYVLVTELAERIGQLEVQAGAFGGMGLCRFMLGDERGARDILQTTLPLADRIVDWFQGRELIEGLRLHLLFLDADHMEARAVFQRSLGMAASGDIYGAAWLTAEFGAVMRPLLPDIVDAAILLYGAQSELLRNPKFRERFAVLKSDS